VLHLCREAQLRQHSHDGLLQPLASRAAGTQDFDAQPASFLLHLLTQGFLEFPQERLFIFFLGGGRDVVPGLDPGKQSLGDLFLRTPPPGFYFFDGRFQAGDADPEFAEGNLGEVLVGHGFLSSS